MPMSVLAATSDKVGLSKADSLALQLKSLFEISGQFAGKKENSFYKTFFFRGTEISRGIDQYASICAVYSFYTYREDNLKWFKDNDTRLKDLQSWFANTKREPKI